MVEHAPMRSRRRLLRSAAPETMLAGKSNQLIQWIRSGYAH